MHLHEWPEFESDPMQSEHFHNRMWRSVNDYYVGLVEASDENIPKRWARDTSSAEAYERSVEPNRRRLVEFLGGWPWQRDDLDARVTPVAECDSYRVERIIIRAMERIEADALLLTPPGDGPRPAVMLQHGLGSTPAMACGFDRSVPAYRAMGHRLARHGYVVLAPRMLGPADQRRQIHRKATLVGHNLFGTELFVLSRWVDYLSSAESVRSDAIGIYGLSQGGQTALFLPAAETRIAAVVTNGWFNWRRKKQIERSEYHTTYMDATDEEDKIYPGHLLEFSDADVASLICPRPFMEEAGRSDPCVDHKHARHEFDKLADIYRSLNIEDRCRFSLFEGGHELWGEEAIPFLDEWLGHAGT